MKLQVSTLVGATLISLLCANQADAASLDWMTGGYATLSLVEKPLALPRPGLPARQSYVQRGASHPSGPALAHTVAALPQPKAMAKKPQPPRRQAARRAVAPKTPIAANSNTPPVDSGLLLRSGVAFSETEVELTLGKAKVINLKKPAARVSISDPNVAQAVIITPTQIQLIGKSVGVANLLLWESPQAKYPTLLDINVHRDVSVLAKQLRILDPGINVMPMAADNSVILTGEAESNESAQKAIELAKAFFKDKEKFNANGGGASTTSSTNTMGTREIISSEAPGTASTQLSGKIINLIKVKGQPSTKLELVRSKLRDIDPAIRLDLIPGPDGSEKVILTGRVSRAGLVSKAINTASVFYGQPGMKVVTGPGGNIIRPTGSAAFQGNTSFSDNLDINILQGSIVTDTSGNVISMMEVTQKPQIKCSVKILEVSRTTLRQLGNSVAGVTGDLSFGQFNGAQGPANGKPIAITGGGVIAPAAGQTFTGGSTGIFQSLGTGATQIFSIDNRIQAAISALEEKRKVRSLAEPNLTMLSGEKASFIAGGEVPIPVLGTNGQISIEYHEFGIRLNLISTVMDDGKIHMQVSPEVSTVDTANSITTNSVTVPGFRTRRMQTTLELQPGQSFVLAGLFNQDETDFVSRFPGIGNLPILGSFFRNQWKDHRQSELLVIVKPDVVMVPNGVTPSSETSTGTLLQTPESVASRGQEILQTADSKKRAQP